LQLAAGAKDGHVMCVSLQRKHLSVTEVSICHERICLS